MQTISYVIKDEFNNKTGKFEHSKKYQCVLKQDVVELLTKINKELEEKDINIETVLSNDTLRELSTLIMPSNFNY